MSNNPDNDYNRQTFEVIKTVEAEFPRAKGILLVGSAANSQRRADSDFDFTVIHDTHETAIQHSKYLQQPPYANINNYSEFDILAMKTKILGTEVGIHNFTLDAFKRVCSLSGDDLRVFRPNPWDEYDYGTNIFGDTVAVRPRADLLPHGGHRLFLPIMIKYDGQEYTGVHVHMFLTNPNILRDSEEVIDINVANLWTNYLMLSKKYLPNINLEQLMKNLWKSHTFNDRTVRFSADQLNKSNATSVHE